MIEYYIPTFKKRSWGNEWDTEPAPHSIGEAQRIMGDSMRFRIYTTSDIPSHVSERLNALVEYMNSKLGVGTWKFVPRPGAEQAGEALATTPE